MGEMYDVESRKHQKNLLRKTIGMITFQNRKKKFVNKKIYT